MGVLAMSIPEREALYGHGPNVYSLVNSSIPVERSLEVPSLRVETVDRSTSAMSSSSLATPDKNKGNVLDSVYSPIVTSLVKTGIGFMMILALFVVIIGDGLVLQISHVFGFVMLFFVSFIIGCGTYLWWVSWVHERIGITIHCVFTTFLICCVSDLVSAGANRVIDLGPFENLPIDISYYSIFTMSLFSLFASVVHQKGTSAMFSHETCVFVCITVVMHYSTWCLFSGIIPSFIHSQIVYTSCLLAMSVSLLLLKHNPTISLVALRRIIRTSIHSKKDLVPASYSGRRFSNVSSMSNMSSIRPRNSLTSQSSISTQSCLDIDTLTEAHGLIGDLLFQEYKMSQKGRESLKNIQQLLSTKVTSNVQYTPRSRLSSGESDVTSLSGTAPRYRKSVTLKRGHRISSSQFTTTTTATGLPNVEKDPQERKRSVAPRDIRTRISVAKGRNSIHLLQRRGRSGSNPSSLSIHQHKISMPSLSSQTSDCSDVDGTSDLLTSSHPVSGSSVPLSEEEEDRKTTAPKRLDSLDVISENGEEARKSEQMTSETETDIQTPQEKTITKSSKIKRYVVPNPLFSLEQYQNNEIELFDHVAEWDFPIFALEDRVGGEILSQMAFCLFKEAGLMETFDLPVREFLNFFRILEANYGSNAYHNKTHAADVLHATSYLLFENIPEFSYELPDTHDTDRVWKGHNRLKPSGGNIASAFSILEVFACYLAAAMHDFDHPGRTNAFLVATKHPLAVLYNDRSVLENHHAAASWDLLTSSSETNFLHSLDSSEMKRFRFLIIECILATDLKQHFSIVRDFKEKCDPIDGGGIDWASDVDRLQVMKMIIKMADISTPTKSYDLHRSWTVRITEEFYQQHEDEMRLNLPQTIFMNRQEKEKLPAIQVSFIQNLVSPLFHACGEAGIIPGILETDLSKSKEYNEGLSDEEMGPDDALQDDDSIPDEALPPTKNIFSIILTNLQMNFESWRDELPKLDDQEIDDEEDEDNED